MLGFYVFPRLNAYAEQFSVPQLRRMIGDFGVPISIFIMIAIDITIEDAYTQVWEISPRFFISN